MAAEKKTDKPKTIKELRRQQIQNIALAMVALFALLAIGLAWFVNNTRVSAGGVQIAAEGERFELACRGTAAGVYDKNFNNEILGETKTINEKIYYTTSGGKTDISWFVNGESNLQNQSERNTLRPGASGSLSFSVIPVAQDLGTMHFTLKMIPYTDAANTDEDAVKIGESYYKPINENTRAYELLKGHLLFFGSNDLTEGYSEQMSMDTVYTDGADDFFHNSSTEPTLHRDYTIYWIWPGLFRQFIDQTGNNRLFGNSTNQAAMLDYIQQHPGEFFSQNTGEWSEDDTLPVLSAGMSSADLTVCSDFYNNGDETIGSTVRYIELKLTAAEG